MSVDGTRKRLFRNGTNGVSYGCGRKMWMKSSTGGPQALAVVCISFSVVLLDLVGQPLPLPIPSYARVVVLGSC